VSDEDAIGERFRALAGELNERQRRLWAAAEARAIGPGGVPAVFRATGIAESTIRRGLADLVEGPLPDGRTRREGGGRKSIQENVPGIEAALEALVAPQTAGDPMSLLKWTSKSVRSLAKELTTQGFPVNFRTVAKLLRQMGYTLQANAKEREGSQHPDRDPQIRFIDRTAKRFVRRRQPVISVDCKKKELVGDFKNAGRTWRPKGSPERVRVHDFKIPQLGKAAPYGVYDVADDSGFVSVGVSADTSDFAVNSIRGWWHNIGAERYPNATELMITADCGGSNGNRTRLWKLRLQDLADETGLAIRVCHFPPGTSKWNKIEHRLFSHISMNWRGRPLENLQTIIDLIGATTTTTGLTVQAQLDPNEYTKGIEVTAEQMRNIQLHPDKWHGEWNYTIKPRPTDKHL
jgi:hypothetical protein